MKNASRRLVRLGLCAIAVIGAQCKPAESSCPQVGCSSVPVIELRVKVSPDELTSATFHICRNAVCLPDLVGPGEARGETRLPRVLVSVGRASGGWSDVGIVYIADIDEPLPDGDRYVVEVRSPAGTLIASLDRQIIYAERSSPNGESCPGHCTSGTLRGYPESAPNLTCSSIACQSGARFELAQPYDSWVKLYAGSLYACRNDVCSSNAHRSGQGSPFSFDGDLTGFTLDINPGPGTEGVVSMTFLEDPSVLANGDHYSLKRGPDPTDEVVFEQTVTYEERFPNGAACDVYPCRSYGLEGYVSP